MAARRFGELFTHWKILRGDKVKIIAGKDKGEVGTIARVLRDQNRVVVEGFNLVKKHVKRTEQQQGGIITIEAPLHVSNVALVDPVTGAAVRTVFRFLEDGTKVRLLTVQHDRWSWRKHPHVHLKSNSVGHGPKDTPHTVSLKDTYRPQGGEQQGDTTAQK